MNLHKGLSSDLVREEKRQSKQRPYIYLETESRKGWRIYIRVYQQGLKEMEREKASGDLTDIWTQTESRDVTNRSLETDRKEEGREQNNNNNKKGGGGL